jgi:hypothetical protein
MSSLTSSHTLYDNYALASSNVQRHSHRAKQQAAAERPRG